MNIKIIENPEQEEDLILSVSKMTPEIERVLDSLKTKTIQVEYQDDTKLINLDSVLFFETESEFVYAHGSQLSFKTRYRLYELEEYLPKEFYRISKSTIVNINRIQALERKLTSSRQIQFFESNKIAYVSRMYFPTIKTALQERSTL